MACKSNRFHQSAPQPATASATGKQKMNTIQFDQPHHDVIDIELPLHPSTDNSEHVALLVQRILGAIEDVAASSREPSQIDIVQALSIATALRTAMAEVSARAGSTLSMNLLDIGVGGNDRKAA
jgi:hypothetical protein